MFTDRSPPFVSEPSLILLGLPCKLKDSLKTGRSRVLVVEFWPGNGLNDSYRTTIVKKMDQ